MLWALIAAFGMLAGNQGTSTAKPTLKSAEVRKQQPTPTLISTALPSPIEDYAAESELLELANEDRRQAGVPALRVDESLSEAARAHARLMVENEQLAHQFEGEPALLQRITQVGPLHLDRAGENVAYNSSAEGAQEALMLSPPHRQNLLDAAFNVAGFAAIWSDGRLYVVEDFGHEVPTYSAQQTRQVVGRAVNELRNRAGLVQLPQFTSPSLDDAVCALARDNRMDARALNGNYGSREIIAYTQSRPEALPRNAAQLLRDGSVRQFAVGTCYAQSAAYPAGMYWVAILLY